MFLLIDDGGKLINIDDISAIEGVPGEGGEIVLRNGQRISTRADMKAIVAALEKRGLIKI